MFYDELQHWRVSAQQSVIIVLQTPTPIVYEVGGGSCVGEKGPQRIKKFKRNCPTCPNCPTLSKCRTQSELISRKTKEKKKDRLRKEVGALCKWRVFKEQKGVKRNYPTKLPHTTVKVENTHDLDNLTQMHLFR